eukprot:CAMPEP_0117009700 /NCGR_PEP_ID=MMETSP0472-20121206/8737_1 /TAXON_ID=693140 ORGANISM="Tiarina fusus, Strain LIS" /NCGR_SAMPLE_ID=MMETSP0472 /ASSEMBLY_ACC=CAM_ASM_000603 /LENGTH=882 /DNA_ID=CAMNT_0004712045 /DNA_START=278 /DNA_END=2926 /DNA_ORIENTATION=-
MGFLKKLFRRKKTSADEGPSGKKNKKPSKAIQAKITENGRSQGNLGNAAVASPREDHAGRKPSLSNTDVTGRGSSSSRENHADGTKDASFPKPLQQSRVLSPRNRGVDESAALPSPDKMKRKIITSHDENMDHSNAASAVSPRLSYQQLQQFDRQHRDTSGLSPTFAGNQATPHQPVYAMSSEIPRQQMHAMDEMNRSDASSSSFNLSTDAEDSEYEQLRRRGVLPGTNTSTLDTSAMSAVSSPTAYTTDDDRIFPALQTDDDMTQATAPSTKEPSVPQTQGLLVAKPTPVDEPGRIQIFPMNTETDDDMRAWTLSPSTQASKEPKSTKSSSSQAFSFQGSSAMQVSGVTPKNAATNNAPTSTTSRNTSGAHRNFTSPKSQASSNTDFSNNDFANFADFSSFPTSTEMEPWKDKKMERTAPRDFAKDFDAFNINSNGNTSSQFPSSFGQQQQDSSLSELLAQAKNKRRSGGRPSRQSSSSVNSAPAITASYLRQQHNLRGYTGSSYGDRSERESRASTEETSVSDIIQSLEATNQSRMKTGSRNSYSHKSVGDTGATSMARAAKERLRDKRRRDRETAGGLHKSRSSEMSSSENSDDNEASESWLFDEVTGALGPRGIAADLESLSGRSNRSKNSQGNKSHKSRSRSHRSRKSSSRRHRSSNESVDSRGSRHSRNSKNSRYSHRSTKSFLSQMSEQSRSVANDLLRLEMQLAMVGSQENRDDVPARGSSSVGGASMGGASRTSRTSRKSLTSHRTHSSSIARRSKASVVAPPGKLGIILANKADSKGTVVSGVRTSSVLAEKISPGDRIIAIDGEDVSRMTVSEITTIMSRKSDYERILTILTTPKHLALGAETMTTHRSPSTPSKSSPDHQFDNSFQQFRR